MMELLFVYGTLKDRVLQRKLLGREVSMRPAVLPEYAVNRSGQYFDLVSTPGLFVEGFILELTVQELLLADQWEEVPLYLRTMVSVREDGHETAVWAYQKSQRDGAVTLLDDPDSLCGDAAQYEADLDEFLAQRSLVLPISDIYLIYPACVRKGGAVNIPNYESHVTQAFKAQFQDTLTMEFGDKQLQSMHHHSMAPFNIQIYGKEQLRVQPYMATDVNGLATLILSVPLCLVKPTYLFEAAYYEHLMVEGAPLSEYAMTQYGIALSDKPKICVFSSADWPLSEKCNLFEAEQSPMAAVISPQLCADATRNLAQYASADIYASSLAVLEIAKDFSLTYLQRMRAHILTLFIVELYIFQYAALSRTHTALQRAIEVELSRSDGGGRSFLEELAGTAVLEDSYWNVNSFLYPTARNLARGIGAALDVAELKSRQKELRQQFERLTDIHKIRKEEIESGGLNSLLLFLALLQVFPIGSELILLVAGGELSPLRFIAYLGSFAGCFTLWLAYRIVSTVRVRRRRSGIAP